METHTVATEVQRGDLLSQGQLLDDQLGPELAYRSQQVNQHGEEENEGVPHRERSLTSKRRRGHRWARCRGPLRSLPPLGPAVAPSA